MKQRHRFPRVLCLCLCLVLALILPARAALPAPCANADSQNYTWDWASAVKSYLYADPYGGLSRVEYDGEKVIVEAYSSSFQLLSGMTLQPELPIWGGFFAGESFNFLIYGQDNVEEHSGKEVIRVVKYSKDWQRLGQASLYGGNTIRPFEAGSLRCAEYGGWLYVRTCHQMYTSADGQNHQANMMLLIRQSDMTITDSFLAPEYGVGYVTHSLNQFVLVDPQGRLVALDQGDAYPRGLTLQRYAVRAGQATFRCDIPWAWLEGGSSQGAVRPVAPYEERTLVGFAGQVGDTATGCTVGGLEATSKGYAVAYSLDSAGGSGSSRDIYLAFVGDGLCVDTHRLTAGAVAGTPQMAALGPEGGYVLWNCGSIQTDQWGYSRFVSDNVLYYAAYSADGTCGSVKTANAPLSDCKPVVYQGRVVWYAAQGGAPVFCILDETGVRQAAAGAASAAGPS